MKPTLRLRCLSVHRCAGLCLGGTLCGNPLSSMSVRSGTSADLMSRDSVGKTWLIRSVLNFKGQFPVPMTEIKKHNVNENTAQTVLGF